MTLTFCNSELRIEFCKDLITEGINIVRHSYDKYVDNTFTIIIYLFGLVFMYNRSKEPDVLHLILKSNNTYGNNENIKKIQAVLRTVVDGETYRKASPPFSFSVEYNGKGEDGNDLYSYYITVKRDWLLKHGLGCLTNDLMLTIDREEIINNKHKFPKYHSYRTYVMYL